MSNRQDLIPVHKRERERERESERDEEEERVGREVDQGAAA